MGSWVDVCVTSNDANSTTTSCCTFNCAAFSDSSAMTRYFAKNDLASSAHRLFYTESTVYVSLLPVSVGLRMLSRTVHSEFAVHLRRFKA